MTVIDLFAGAGGWDVAANRLGFDPIGLEFDSVACETRRAAGLRTMECDVAAVALDDPAMGWRGTGVSGLIASPPCQGFSAAGRRRGQQDVRLINRCAIQMGRGRDMRAEYAGLCADERSMLVVEPLRWALALRPEWLAWEQVPPVLPFWELCATVLRRHGYRVWTGCLQAEQFGVPQTRKRAFLMASRVGAVAPPAPTHSRFYSRNPGKLDLGVLPWVSMAEALGWDADALVGFPRAADAGEAVDIDGTAYRARDLRGASFPAFNLTEESWSWQVFHMAAGQTGQGRPRPLDQPAGTVTTKGTGYFVANARANAAARPVEHPAPTITAGHDSGDRHWAFNRPATTVAGDSRIPKPGWRGGRAQYEKGEEIPNQMDGAVRVTVAQAAVLQSFPADFPFQGSKTRQFLQVGNAVPPLLAEAVLRAVVPS